MRLPLASQRIALETRDYFLMRPDFRPHVSARNRIGDERFGAEGVIAGVRDAGATFLAPLYDELTAIVCTGGTPRSHIGIVSREFQVPCVMSAVFDGDEPIDGHDVEVDCSGEEGIIRG